MNNRDERKKSLPVGKIIGLLVVLMSLPAELIGVIIGLGIIGFVFYLGFKAARSGKRTGRRTPDNFDDCPQPLFCFHRDKGEHHVRRGKEIDPWDRPDIDISKYQRR